MTEHVIVWRVTTRSSGVNADKARRDHAKTLGRVLNNAFGEHATIEGWVDGRWRPVTYDPLADDGEHAGHEHERVVTFYEARVRSVAGWLAKNQPPSELATVPTAERHIHHYPPGSPAGTPCLFEQCGQTRRSDGGVGNNGLQT